MAQHLGGWIHSFTVTETCTHKEGYTIYKITSIIFPRSVPEALTCISVWKRFQDLKKLYRELKKRHKNLSLNGIVPKPKNDFFKRFNPETIKARKQYILTLLDFAALHPALYKSQSFLSFFETDYSPNNSPIRVKNNLNVGNIEKICNKLDLTYDDDICLIDVNNDANSNEDFNDENPELSLVSSDIADKAKTNTNTTCSDIDKISEHVDEISLTNFSSIVSIDEDDADYIYEAALEFSQAVQAEVNLEYNEAHKKYKNGIDKLLCGSKDEKNEERKFIAKAKVAKYMARADEIYEKFILHCENEKKLSFQLSIDMSEDASTETSYLERPWNQLSRYKVIQAVDKVLQVQDVTDKSIYIIKGIEKPSYSSVAQSIFLPQGVPYMVELIGYFQSVDKIFLLLQQAKGGKLFDYINMYSPETETPSSFNEIFEHIKDSDNNTEQDNDDVFKDDIKSNSFENIQKHTSEENSEIEHGVKLVARKPEQKNDTSFATIVSNDVDINDLVDCSQKLLNSVSRTLDKSKNNSIELKSTKTDIFEETRNNDEYNISNTLQLPISTTINQKRKFLIPEVCIKQWAKELVEAIDCLHTKGVILGDLHSDNLLLGSKGQLLLTYFYQNEGCDPLINATYKSLVNGSFFIAPERPLTMKSDWWSFGMVLYELLTGRSFKSCHPGGLYRYFEIQFPDINLSNDARNLLEGLLVIEPENRLDSKSIKTHEFFDGTVWNNLYQ